MAEGEEEEVVLTSCRIERTGLGFTGTRRRIVRSGRCRVRGLEAMDMAEWQKWARGSRK